MGQAKELSGGRARLAPRLGSAALAGSAGLGLEVVLLSSLGLAIGSDRAAAVGLATWIAGWALGAWLAGARLQRGASPRRLVLEAAAASALLAELSLHGVLWSAHSPVASAGLLAPLLVLLAALPQGGFLPLLTAGAKAGRGSAAGGGGSSRLVYGLYGANLLGSLAGAVLVGQYLPHLGGLVLAAHGAALLVIGAGLLAWLAVPSASEDAGDGEKQVDPGLSDEGLSPARAGLLLGLATAAMLGAEWVALRLGGLWLGGMQPALAALLAASLASLVLGAWVLPPLLPRGPRALPPLLLLIAAGSTWPLYCAPLLGSLRDGSPLLLALALTGPLLFAYGALVPCLAASITAGPRARAGSGTGTGPRSAGSSLGGLLLHESWGALVGAPVAHFLLVTHVGLAGTLGVLDLVLAAGALFLLGRRPRVLVAMGGLGAAGVVLLLASPPALDSPQLSNPALEVLSFEEDEAYAVSVVRDGVRGELTLLTDDFRATGTGDDYLYMRVLGHLPVLLHPAPRRVGVLAFGTGTTAGAVSMHPEVQRIDVFELSAAVVEAAPAFREVNRGVLDEGLPGLLDDGDGMARSVVHLGDGRRRLRAVDGKLDVLTMEPLLPDSPFAVYLYTREFYEGARRSLAPGGLVCQWVPPHALPTATFEAVLGAFAESFPWSGVFLFGTQVILVGGDQRPDLQRSAAASMAYPERDTADGASSGQELSLSLALLGLDGPGGIAARLVCEGADLDPPARPLTDADPWIVHARPHERGIEQLGDLPDNLAWLRRRESRLPGAWRDRLVAEELARREGVLLLHRAREVFEAGRARSMGWSGQVDAALPALVDLRVELERTIPGDGERLVFERWVEFDSARTTGVALLRGGAGGQALEQLTRAAQLRPERGDVHLLVAVAALLLDELPLARSAAARSVELCPRILETPQGQVALALDRTGRLAELARQ